jgi:hypothetical protein
MHLDVHHTLFYLIEAYFRQTYLHICVSTYLCKCKCKCAKKITKKKEENRRHHLKKTVPTGSNVYLCICIFSKEITASANGTFMGIVLGLVLGL